ncbi:hypothetical protein FKG94_05160 [Exilibacterium tricleocarpae]|uniref:Uncharacterized protein n=1 Tax=Exilibacterium tricleocarpae TaxID=2591008 RepID=A0A545U3M3_9GAMM|nr:hypothetical protein [Exilibacterium tricleocarpae]TQV84056.1 hypothetical protein FKG94_05160 [Exilibacterium tricleocarpae]
MPLPLVGSAVSAIATGVLSGGASHVTQETMQQNEDKLFGETEGKKEDSPTEHKPGDVNF